MKSEKIFEGNKMNKKTVSWVLLSIIVAVTSLGAAPFVPIKAVVPDNGFGYTMEKFDVFNAGRWTDISTNPANKLSISYANDGWAYAPNFFSTGFKFFDQVYKDQPGGVPPTKAMWVSVNGLVGFGSPVEIESSTNTIIPFDPLPNALVAGFWADLTLAEDVEDGAIYYKLFSGSERPLVCTETTRVGYPASTNQCAIVQWNRVLENGGGGTRNTFQIVLFDTGEIHVLYHTMGSDSDIATIGLEDAEGVYGLQAFHKETGVVSGNEIAFYYPAPQLRHKVRPIYQSEFMARNGSLMEHVFTIQVINNGDISSPNVESYNITVEGTNLPPGWSVTPLVSNTGNIIQKGTVDVQVRVTAPLAAAAGDYVDANVVFTPPGLPTRAQKARLVAAISAPFAQIVHNDDLYMRTMWDRHQANRLINEAFTGTNMSIAPVQGSTFFVVWERGGQINNLNYSDIQYAFVTSHGNNFPDTMQNTQNKDWIHTPLDLYPSVDVGLDGRPAYAFVRSEYFGPMGIYSRYNVRLTILNSDGTPSCPIAVLDDPCDLLQNLTDNGLADDDPLAPVYENPRLTITSTGKYAVTWTKTLETIEGTSRIIEMALVKPDGNMVVPVMTVFEDTSNNFGYYETNITRFNGTQLLVTAIKRDEINKTHEIVYTVINGENGTPVVAETSFGASAARGQSPDAVQLPSGEGLLAWIGDQFKVNYAVIGSNGALKTLPNHIDSLGYIAELDLPETQSNLQTRLMQAVSVTREPNGNFVLTWIDKEDDYLFYALVDRLGNIVTPSMIIAKDVNNGPVLSSKFGYGNAFFVGKVFNYLPLILR